jgi:RNA polymerase sigma-70 factor, ECF subfamily
MSDSELIQRIIEKDENSLRIVVEKYQNFLFKTCFGLLRNKEDAEEAVQDTFIQVYRKIYTYRGESKFSTWLYRIAVNMCINRLRKNRNDKLFQSVSNFFAFSFLNKEDQAFENNHFEELSERQRKEFIIDKAIQSLPKNQRIAFILHKYNDLSQQETADILNTSVSAVESLVFRAKMNLQKTLIQIYNEN